jgi:hypothetical protein
MLDPALAPWTLRQGGLPMMMVVMANMVRGQARNVEEDISRLVLIDNRKYCREAG